MPHTKKLLNVSEVGEAVQWNPPTHSWRYVCLSSAEPGISTVMSSHHSCQAYLAAHGLSVAVQLLSGFAKQAPAIWAAGWPPRTAGTEGRKNMEDHDLALRPVMLACLVWLMVFQLQFGSQGCQAISTSPNWSVDLLNLPFFSEWFVSWWVLSACLHNFLHFSSNKLTRRLSQQYPTSFSKATRGSERE